MQKGPKLLQKMSEIFGLVFLIESKWEYVTDSFLESDGLINRQWLAAIDRLFDHAPSVQEVASPDQYVSPER